MTYFSDREIRSAGNIRAGDALLAGGKYVTVDPNATGVIYQQASTVTIAANNSSASVTFPTAFSAAPRVYLQQASNADATATIFRAVASDTSPTAFVVKANSTATGAVNLYWFAHGLK